MSTLFNDWKDQPLELYIDSMWDHCDPYGTIFQDKGHDVLPAKIFWLSVRVRNYYKLFQIRLMTSHLPGILFIVSPSVVRPPNDR